MIDYNPRANDRLIDRMIGDAFNIVKLVYDNMPMIKTVADALSLSTIGQPLLVQRAIVQTGSSSNAGETTKLDLPDYDMDYKKILFSSVRIEGKSGKHFYEGSGHFQCAVTQDGLEVTLDADAPSDVCLTVVQWFMIYGG